jgi:hypothetical protein
MNVEIGAEAALFPEKEYIYGIFVAVQKRVNHIFSSRKGVFLRIFSQRQSHGVFLPHM